MAKRGSVPWNKGRSYIISKRTVYANKGAWKMALMRFYGTGCMRCGWNDAWCDAHHLVPISDGGEHSIANGVLLCPNCHRLAHCIPEIRDSLPALKAATSPINERR